MAKNGQALVAAELGMLFASTALPVDKGLCDRIIACCGQLMVAVETFLDEVRSRNTSEAATKGSCMHTRAAPQPCESKPNAHIHRQTP